MRYVLSATSTPVVSAAFCKHSKLRRSLSGNPLSPATAQKPLPIRRRQLAVTTTAAMPTPFLFTPIESGLGGLALGVLSYAKLSITGRILGISGTVRGLLQGSDELWRVAFVTGLLAGGLVLRVLLPGAFEVFPASYSLGRAALAGVLVGLGTSRGTGCTSGHGICGNARLSARSFAATCTFMASGVLFTWLAGTAEVFGLPQGIAPLAPTPDPSFSTFGGAVLVASVATWLLLALGAKKLTAPSRVPSAQSLKLELAEADALDQTPASTTATPPPAAPDAQKLAALSITSDLLVGLLFALGLGVSGMLKPSKVAAFLGVLSSTFDPSLMCVMGGALFIALPTFQWALRHSQPLASLKFDLPRKQSLDPSLIIGALLFGAGWGIGGICPGPGLVSLASLQPQALMFVACMAVGMRLDSVFDVIMHTLTGKKQLA